ncbi:MAG: PP2C family protein-serine/threonine phosphatase [Lachnospiraceae bacterium]|nr:PP2C family protein-serine/threonine phosphatase [Lachnospiraceae bacterium]
MEKKKVKGILPQIRRPMIIYVVLIVVVMSLFLIYYNTFMYIINSFQNVEKLSREAVDLLEDYHALKHLCVYWDEHAGEMNLCYEEDALLAKETQLRVGLPEMGNLQMVSNEEFDHFTDAEKKLFAEVSYGWLCEQFDRMKRNYDPVFIFSFTIREDNVLHFQVTGAKDEEKRISEGGEIFELGYDVNYVEGTYSTLDKYRAGEPQAEDFIERMLESMDEERVHAYLPVVMDGETICYVGVAEEWRMLLTDGVVVSAVVTAFSVIGFMILGSWVINKIRRLVIVPLYQTQEIIHNYENNKSAKEAVEALQKIRTDNETEELAGSFSGMVGELERYIENVRKVTAEKDRIETELNVAAKIQADLLPRIFPPYPDRKEFELYAIMDPAKEVGGDFYDFFLIDDDHIGLVIADVAGKGVPAALFMVISRTMLKNRAQVGGSPAEILADVNDQLCEGNEEEMFVTVWFAIIELSTGKGVSVNAGHEHPILKRKNGDYEMITYRHGMALAIMQGIPIPEREFVLEPGDRIFVYTDGAPEANNANNELYGTDRLLMALNQAADQPSRELMQSVRASIDAFAGDMEQFDDTTMLEFRYFGPQG